MEEEIDELENNLNIILNEIIEKVIPSNFREGSNVLGVTGTLKSMNNYEACDIIATNILSSESKPYIELEYIEGNGNQYVTTDYIPNSSTKIEMLFGDVSAASTIESAVILSATSVFSNTNRYLLGAYSGEFAWSGTSSASHVGFGSGSYLGEHTLSINNNIIMFDGVTVLNNTSTTFTDLTYLSLWKCLANNSTNAVGRYKLYYLKIYEDDTLVRNYIPVRSIEGDICLYDTVNKTFIYNQGTDSFIAGGIKQ